MLRLGHAPWSSETRVQGWDKTLQVLMFVFISREHLVDQIGSSWPPTLAIYNPIDTTRLGDVHVFVSTALITNPR